MLKYDNGKYIEMTAEEIDALYAEPLEETQPTLEERLAALEAAMLEQILEG